MSNVPAVLSPDVLTATIAAGAAESNALDLAGMQVVGLIMPADWTTANISVKVSDIAGGTYVPLYDDNGTEIVITAAASRGIGLDSKAMPVAPYRYVKLCSGVVGTYVNQVKAAAIKVILKG